MKSFILFSLLSSSAFAHYEFFNGQWSSKNISVVSPYGDYENCESVFFMTTKNNEIVMTDTISIRCSGYNFYLQTYNYQINPGGALTTAMGRGQIEEDSMELIVSEILPDDSLGESKTDFVSTGKSSMNFHYLLEKDGNKIEYRGDFFRM